MGKRPHKDTLSLPLDLPESLQQPESLPSKPRTRKSHVPQPSHSELKRRARKSKYLHEKHQKAQQRATYLNSITQHSQLSEGVKEVLIPSSELGQLGTMKDKLKRELKRRKLGLAQSEDVPLMVKIRPTSPEIVKKPCLMPKITTIPSPESSISEPENWNESSESDKEQDKVHPILPETLDLDVLAGFKLAPEDSEMKVKECVQVQRSSEIQKSRSELPIISMEREVTEAILDHPFTIICGATGSGKSTQVPQFLYELGFSHEFSKFKGKIGITQPRRVAAMTLAQRVAQELGLVFGKEVGYQIRFDVHTIHPQLNHIKFMTDGILLKEIESDFLLTSYSVLIIDEAHERSVNTDILLGMLARIVPLRAEMSGDKTSGVSELKVVIMSATLRVEDFVGNQRLFPRPPPVINVEARQFPVAIHYAKATDRDNYLDLAYKKVIKIHRNLPPGGILVFLTGKRDVDQLKMKLKYALKRDSTAIFPLYSALSPTKQLRIFADHPGKRLIVIATNIAETSLTIPTVKYVVDCGLEKRKIYAGKLQMSAYVVDWIARSSADQRAGRAGRISPGHCYRLYTLAVYNTTFPDFRPPEVLTTPIEGTLLLLKSMGIKDVTKFPFPTSPDENAVKTALDLLINLGALERISGTKTDKIDHCRVTSIGKEMAKLPISPRFSKMLVLSQHYKIEKLMSLTAAALSIEQVFNQEITDETGKISKSAVKKTHSKWQNSKSDALGLLNLCLVYFSQRSKSPSKSSFEDSFCAEQSINLKSMREIGELSTQLLAEMTGKRVTLDEDFGEMTMPTEEEYDKVVKCVVAGFVDRIAMRDVEVSEEWKDKKKVPYFTSEFIDISLYSEEYKMECSNKEYVFIHPSSYLYGHNSPALVAYQDLIFTSRPYMRCITVVQPEWLLDLGAHLMQPYSPLPLPVPTIVNGEVKCWVEPAFGPKCWKLQPMQVSYPVEDKSITLWLLRFIMEGKVGEKGQDMKGVWSVKTGNVTNTAASGTQQTISKAVSVLRTHSITSLPTLRSSDSKVQSRLKKALQTMVVPAQIPRFQTLWSQLSPT